MAYEREDGTWESLTAQFCFLAISQHSSQALTCPFSLVRLRAGVSLQEGPLHSIHPWRMPCDCADPQPSLSLPGLGHTSPPGLFSWLETETVLKPSSQQSDFSALLFPTPLLSPLPCCVEHLPNFLCLIVHLPDSYLLFFAILPLFLTFLLHMSQVTSWPFAHC